MHFFVHKALVFLSDIKLLIQHVTFESIVLVKDKHKHRSIFIINQYD